MSADAKARFRRALEALDALTEYDLEELAVECERSDTLDDVLPRFTAALRHLATHDFRGLRPDGFAIERGDHSHREAEARS